MSTSPIYSKLEEADHESDSVTLSDDASNEQYSERRSLRERTLEYMNETSTRLILRRPLQSFGLLIICSSAFFFSLGMFVRSLRGVDETACLDTHWDVVRNAMSFETVEFNPRFTGAPSPYMGQPNSDLDTKWYELAELRNFGVDRATLQSMNRSRGAVQFLQDGKYQVGMEAFHQLHCLNYVRMYTYMDHYEGIDYDMVAESAEERRDHKDHCVEVLRQRLMCNPDLNVYSYHWVSRHDQAWGNLFTSHRCVNWDLFHNWAQENLVRYYPPKTKPEGVEVWE